MSKSSIIPIQFMTRLMIFGLALLGASRSVSAQQWYGVNNTAYQNEDVFQEDILNATNWFRRHYNASELMWNDTLADFAATVTKKCLFKHSGGPYGENLAAGYANASAAIGAWGNESTKYNYGKPGFSLSTGHFTQLVWTNTTSVGCARKNCTGTDGDDAAPGWFVVCEYYPRGNFLGEFPNNVNKPVGGTASSSFGRRNVGLSTLLAVLLAVLTSALM